MIVFDESEYLESDFSDDTLRMIQGLLGHQVKDMLLLPQPVRLNHDHRTIGVLMGTQERAERVDGDTVRGEVDRNARIG